MDMSAELLLKYGCNPHQTPAKLKLPNTPPFHTLNGSAGYINLLDALNAWQLVREADIALELPTATSFKHVSPAGVAVGQTTKEAYAKARSADPSASFGDMIAVSRTVDAECAKFIKTVVSDGIIAPDYDEEALKILSAKKGGRYLVLKADPNYQPPVEELREVFGVQFIQKRNDLLFCKNDLFKQIVTKQKDLSESAQRDLLLSAITLKYTQSNSVGYAVDGQMIGIGAGQQSRIACVKLAGQKALLWHLARSPHVQALPFKSSVTKIEKINAVSSYINDDMTDAEYKQWLTLFEKQPEPFNNEAKQEWISKLKEVSFASDAFFPFRDNIDQASRIGVRYVLQTGGSLRDQDVIDAADDYQMTMVFSRIRSFHH